MKNMVISQKAPFMRTLRYIFLTEWQLLCKSVWIPGSRGVPRAPSKPTAHSTHGPPCPKDGRQSCWHSKEFLAVLLPPWSKGFVTFHDRSKIAALHSGPTEASMIHGQTLADSSQPQQPWFLGGPVCLSRDNTGDLERQSLCWQRFRASAGHVWTGDEVERWNPSGSRLEKQRRGGAPRSDKWSLAWRGFVYKFDKNPKLGHGFRSASQEHTHLSRRNPAQSVFSCTIGT